MTRRLLEVVGVHGSVVEGGGREELVEGRREAGETVRVQEVRPWHRERTVVRGEEEQEGVV